MKGKIVIFINSLKERAQALWGLRIAFTHADGNTEEISNEINKAYAVNSASIFSGMIEIDNNELILKENLYHNAIRTIVQIRDVIN